MRQNQLYPKSTLILLLTSLRSQCCRSYKQFIRILLIRHWKRSSCSLQSFVCLKSRTKKKLMLRNTKTKLLTTRRSPSSRFCISKTKSWYLSCAFSTESVSWKDCQAKTKSQIKTKLLTWKRDTKWKTASCNLSLKAKRVLSASQICSLYTKTALRADSLMDLCLSKKSISATLI